MRSGSKRTSDGLQVDGGTVTEAYNPVRSERNGSCTAPCRVQEVLLVQRDPELRVSLTKALFGAGFSHTPVSSPKEALACLRQGSFALVLLEIESEESIRFLGQARRAFPHIPIVAVSRIATPELVRDVLRAGAHDFLFDRLDSRTLASRLGEILSETGREAAPEPDAREGEGDRGETETVAPGAEVRKGAAEERIVCRNPKMQRLLEIIETIAPTDATVLIQGAGPERRSLRGGSTPCPREPPDRSSR